MTPFLKKDFEKKMIKHLTHKTDHGRSKKAWTKARYLGVGNIYTIESKTNHSFASLDVK